MTNGKHEQPTEENKKEDQKEDQDEAPKVVQAIYVPRHSASRIPLAFEGFACAFALIFGYWCNSLANHPQTAGR